MDEWMESWVRNVEMMDPRMDVREDRLTHQMKDEWILMAGCSGTLTDKQGPTLHTQEHQKCNYPISFTCNDCRPKNAVDDTLWQVMVFDLVRKTFFRCNSLILLRKRPALWVLLMVNSEYVTCPAAGVCPGSGESVCLHLPLLPCVRMCMYDHMRLCKIHKCHCVYKQFFVLVQSKTEHVWLWLEVTSGAKLNKEVYLLSLQEKKTWQHSGVHWIKFKHALFLAQC